jgi:hypothetical protein
LRDPTNRNSVWPNWSNGQNGQAQVESNHFTSFVSTTLPHGMKYFFLRKWSLKAVAISILTFNNRDKDLVTNERVLVTNILDWHA